MNFFRNLTFLNPNSFDDEDGSCNLPSEECPSNDTLKKEIPTDACDVEDTCKLPRVQKDNGKRIIKLGTVGRDPRFLETNQTLRCWTSYVDFYNCEHILGEGHDACAWFKKCFMTICPRQWVEKFDEQRLGNRFIWHKRRKFPEAEYGKP